MVLLVGHAADPHEVTKHEQWAIQHMSYAQNVLVLVHDMVCGAGNCVGSGNCVGGVGNCVGGGGNCFFSHSPLLVVLFLWLVLFGALLILSSVLLISSCPPFLLYLLSFRIGFKRHWPKNEKDVHPLWTSMIFTRGTDPETHVNGSLAAPTAPTEMATTPKVPTPKVPTPKVPKGKVPKGRRGQNTTTPAYNTTFTFEFTVKIP